MLPSSWLSSDPYGTMYSGPHLSDDMTLAVSIKAAPQPQKVRKTQFFYKGGFFMHQRFKYLSFYIWEPYDIILWGSESWVIWLKMHAMMFHPGQAWWHGASLKLVPEPYIQPKSKKLWGIHGRGFQIWFPNFIMLGLKLQCQEAWNWQ